MFVSLSWLVGLISPQLLSYFFLSFSVDFYSEKMFMLLTCVNGILGTTSPVARVCCKFPGSLPSKDVIALGYFSPLLFALLCFPLWSETSAAFATGELLVEKNIMLQQRS